MRRAVATAAVSVAAAAAVFEPRASDEGPPAPVAAATVPFATRPYVVGDDICEGEAASASVRAGRSTRGCSSRKDTFVEPPPRPCDERRARAVSVRVRTRPAALHADDPSHRGTTAHLFAHDPHGAYRLGRALFTREFSAAEGVLGRQIARPMLEDGVTPVVPGARVGSCVMCHSTPLGDAGSGPTIEKNGRTGRNTPHLFGAGLVEMIGWEIRLRVLALGDADGDGFVGTHEAVGVRAVIGNLAPGTPGERYDVDFGRFGDADGDGLPDLNPVCRVWFVDALGRRLPWAERLGDPGVAGYDFEVEVFGWGHTPRSRAPLSSTLRGFAAAAFNVHSGLQAHDPTLNAGDATAGVTGLSLAGAPQFFTGRTPDLGRRLGTAGASLDDPDGDGVADELTEGDMDVLEFFLLHHPAPAERAATPRTQRGRGLFSSMGCTVCHVPDWTLPAESPPHVDPGRRSFGDRRSFAVIVAPDPATGALRRRIETRKPWRPPVDAPDGSALASGGAAAHSRPPLAVRGVYSDFRHHDVGPLFHQQQFDGSVVRRFRTPPLWGVGSSAPYGHDGASLDLDSVIRRHGGEAEASAAAWAAAADDDREDVLSFLRGLVLYGVDDVPLDGGTRAAVRPRAATR